MPHPVRARCSGGPGAGRWAAPGTPAAGSPRRRGGRSARPSRCRRPAAPGLGAALLTGAQFGHRRGQVRVGHELIAAQRLDGQNASVAQHPGRGPDRVPVADLRAVRRQQPHPGTAGPARVGLGVEAPVGGRVVLLLARGAHHEVGHGRQRPVVGKAFDDAVTRPAVGAVDQGVAVPAVPGVHQLGDTVRTDEAVGGDEPARPAVGAALPDGEGGVPLPQWLLGEYLTGVDTCEARQLRIQVGPEGVHRGAWSFDADGHAPHVVEHPAAQQVPGGQAVDEGAEAHPLDETGDP